MECTVNRIGDVYRDQTRLTGHHDRPGDLAAFAAIGITKLRYPVLWERVAPHDPNQRDWHWTDQRIAEIGRVGMTPIVGLLHHGSGPAYTDLLDDAFPSLFADFAAAAERYPFVADWTPVNEPLTTARFSALYGHWYPHARDERSFWKALLNQVDAIRLAMRAIRRVNPTAQLIQTEDLGRTRSTPDLDEVATYYNDRRWLTWDLLCGRVVPGHPMWRRLAASGFAERLSLIAADPCPPDVIGVNHYVTSDRYLDRDPARGALPPAGFHDLDAVRVLDPPSFDLGALLTEVHERYRLPVALTECHIGCTREEQMRWLAECWNACITARRSANIIALTTWALAGNVDWDSLLTETRNSCEAGAFAEAGPVIRPTAQARLLQQLASGPDIVPDGATTPILGTSGWWRRPIRFAGPGPANRACAAPKGALPILIIGRSGTLGRAFAGACDMRALAHVVTDRATLPIDDFARIAAVLDEIAPWAVINATGWVRIDDAEKDVAGCRAANTHGAINVARACDERDIPYLGFSSDQVFDGQSGMGYDEGDKANPLNAYGTSKLLADQVVLGFKRSLIARTSAFFSPYDPHNFAMQLEASLRDERSFPVSDEYVVSPTYVPHLVNACLDLLIDEERGLWHLSNGDMMTWHRLGVRIAVALGLDARLLIPAAEGEVGWSAARPRHAGLRSRRGRMLPNVEAAISHYTSIRGTAACAGTIESSGPDVPVRASASR